MLDPFEGFLNSLSGVIKRAEDVDGIGVQVEKRGDEEAQLVAEHLANETNFSRSGRPFVIERLPFAGDWQSDNFLKKAGSAKFFNNVSVQACQSACKNGVFVAARRRRASRPGNRGRAPGRSLWRSVWSGSKSHWRSPTQAE